MKKIVSSFLSFALIGLSSIAHADDLLAWAQYSVGTWVAPGCYWQDAGTTAKGPIYNLICNGSYAATRTSDRPAPEIISASGDYYAVPRAGGAGTPINGYNYAIYKRPPQPPVCKAPWTKPSFDTLQQVSTARGYAEYYKSCDSTCKLDIVTSGPNNSKYDLICH